MVPFHALRLEIAGPGEVGMPKIGIRRLYLPIGHLFGDTDIYLIQPVVDNRCQFLMGSDIRDGLLRPDIFTHIDSIDAGRTEERNQLFCFPLPLCATWQVVN
jgi:hypothetical protein